MISLKIAWRNIWRSKRRSVLTILAVAFSCTILVFFLSLQRSSWEASVNANASIFQGHLQVQRVGYNEFPDMEKLISAAAALEAQLGSLSGVRAAGLRAFGFAVVSSAERSYGAQIVGVEPQREMLLSTIPGLIKSGGYFTPGPQYQAVIGASLAANLKVAVGDELTILGQTAQGSVAAAILKIEGIFDTGVGELDRNLIQIGLADFQELFEMPDQAHALVINLNSAAALPEVEQRIKTILGTERDLTVLNWEQLSPGLKQAIELDMSFGWLFYTSLVLIGTFSVLNTFLMSILERTREYGLLMALGLTPLRLLSTVMLESALLLGCGLLAGISCGAALVIYYGIKGFQVPGSEEIMQTFNLSTAVHPSLSVAALTLGPLMILFFGLAAALLPALRIRKISPVEALRAI